MSMPQGPDHQRNASPYPCTPRRLASNGEMKPDWQAWKQQALFKTTSVWPPYFKLVFKISYNLPAKGYQSLSKTSRSPEASCETTENNLPWESQVDSEGLPQARCPSCLFFFRKSNEKTAFPARQLRKRECSSCPANSVSFWNPLPSLISHYLKPVGLPRSNSDWCSSAFCWASVGMRSVVFPIKSFIQKK